MEEEEEVLSTSHGPLQNSTAYYGGLNPNSMFNSGPLENSLASRLSGVIPSLSRASLGLSDISGSEGLEDQVLLSSSANCICICICTCICIGIMVRLGEMIGRMQQEHE